MTRLTTKDLSLHWRKAVAHVDGDNELHLITDTAETVKGAFINSSCIRWDNGQQWNKIPNITKVYIIFMNHVDIGYDGISPSVGYVNNVLNKYFHQFFPQAMKLVEVVKLHPKLSFIYTTQPWLVSMYLNCPPNMVLSGIPLQCPNKEEVAAFAEAIKAGHIAIHAGAMNMQYGMMSSDSIIASVELASHVYQQLGIKQSPRVLSLRDVPGLTKNSLTALYSAGVRAISVGVNGGSAPPAVPRLFNWTDVGILSMWHPGGYPLVAGKNLTYPGGLAYKDCLYFLKEQTALAFAFRDDNQGPPLSVDEIEGNFAILQAQFPNAELVASSFDTFYEEVLSHVQEVQPFSMEIGDTWLQGIQSDPRKTAEYRAMETAYSRCIRSDSCDHQDQRVKNASRFMTKIAEHTWGIWGGPDGYSWSNEQFEKVRPEYDYIEDTWREQRTFINYTLEALGEHPLATMMKDELDLLKPALNSLSNCDKTSLSNFVFNFTINGTQMQVEFNKSFGFMTGLREVNSGQWLINNVPFGQVVYHSYNQTDFDHYTDLYAYFNNPGIDKGGSTYSAKPVSNRWYTKLLEIYYCKPATFVAHMTMQDMTSHSYYGSPSQFWMNYTFESSDSLVMELLWMDKTTTRLGEATMLNFHFDKPSDNVVVLFDDKNEASMFDVVLNGSQLQHGGHGVRTDNFTVYSHHVQLVCPIATAPIEQATVFPVPLTPIKQAAGVAFNLHNNIWSTNYVMWYPFDNEEDSDFKAIFTAKLTPQSDYKIL